MNTNTSLLWSINITNENYHVLKGCENVHMYRITVFPLYVILSMQQFKVCEPE